MALAPPHRGGPDGAELLRAAGRRDLGAELRLGLGLAQRLDPAVRVPATVGVWVVVAATVALAAHVWLRRFERGPLEAVWAASYRALARR